MITNYLFGTHPVVVHSPGENPIFPTITARLFASPPRQIGNIDNLTIFTWNNGDGLGLLEKSLAHLGVPCEVLGKGIRPWVNKEKIRLTIDFLKTVKTEYVAGIDSYDAVAVGDPNELLKTYLEHYQNQQIVFNSTIGNWPGIDELNELEARAAPPNHPFKHLNAGAWIGTTRFCKKFFERTLYLEDQVEEKYPDFYWSEQVRVKLCFQTLWPLCGIDYECRMFQTLNLPKYYKITGKPEDQYVTIS